MYKLLIIDDYESITYPIKCFFERKNYIIYVAHTAEEGLSCIRENKPDIVLLDIGLPDISGLDVLGKIREKDRDTRVIMITGQDYADNIEKAKCLGISDYVKKPLALGLLAERIDNIAEELSLEREYV